MNPRLLRALIAAAAGQQTSAPATYAMPGETHLWRGDSMTVSGSNVLAVADQVAKVDLASDSVDYPTVTTVGGQPAWMHGGSKYFRGTLGGATETPLSGAILLVHISASSLATRRFVCSVRASDSVTTGMLSQCTSTGFSFRRASSTPTVEDTTVYAVDTPYATLLSWSPTEAQIWHNGVLAATETSNDTVHELDEWVVGATPTGANNCGCAIAEVRTGETHLTGADVTALFAYTSARYGLP